MENLFNYISKQVDPEEVDIWFKINNIIPEKLELYYDFCHSLYLLIISTYLGDDDNKETNIQMTEEDNLKHFVWCWNKNIENFSKENILFELDGDHFKYFYTFFLDIFIIKKKKKSKAQSNSFSTICLVEKNHSLKLTLI